MAEDIENITGDFGTALYSWSSTLLSYESAYFINIDVGVFKSNGALNFVDNEMSHINQRAIASFFNEHMSNVDRNNITGSFTANSPEPLIDIQGSTNRIAITRNYLIQGSAQNCVRMTGTHQTNLFQNLITGGQNGLQLDQSSISTLISIAEECPTEGGKGVYTARTILSYLKVGFTANECSGLNNRMLIEEKNSSERKSDYFNVLGNPGNDIRIEINYEKTSILKIIRVTGELIREVAVDTNSRVSIPDLQEGLYMVSLFDELNNHLQTKKIVVVK